MYIAMFSLFVSVVFGAIVIYALPSDIGGRGAISIEHAAYANAQSLGDLLPVVHQAAQRWVADNPGFAGEVATGNIQTYLPPRFQATARFQSTALSNGAVLTRIRGPEKNIAQVAIAARAFRRYPDPGVGVIQGGVIQNRILVPAMRFTIPAGLTADEGEVVIYSPRLP